MKFCKKCGTLITKDMGVCPKCSTVGLEGENEPREMGEEELKKERIKSWIWIIVGVPGLIGLIYLIIYLMKLISN